MKVNSKRTIEINLTLNADEADWLKGFIQNPLRDDEPEKEKNIRFELFNILKDELKGVK